MIIIPEVQAALDADQPVVAFESTVFSTLGLPPPHNRMAIERAHAEVRSLGVVPAMTAVLDGTGRVGVEPHEWDRILTATEKIAARDLPVAVGLGFEVGVTTVSASLVIAAAAGIRVFATGGIGGVHADASTSGDISADLGSLAEYPVVTVSAGAKSFLDLGRTLEHLEMLSVPVLGYGTDRFPAFTALDSGLPVPRRVDSPDAAAAVARARFAMGMGGMLVAVPPPTPLDDSVARAANASAEAAADAAGIVGAARTPYVLEQVAIATDGASIAANIDLVVNNARVAAEIALAL